MNSSENHSFSDNLNSGEIIAALTFQTSSEVTKSFLGVTPKSDFLLIGAGTITLKGSMNTANFGKTSVFAE